jgi:hypothetical protein
MNRPTLIAMLGIAALGCATGAAPAPARSPYPPVHHPEQPGPEARATPHQAMHHQGMGGKMMAGGGMQDGGKMMGMCPGMAGGEGDVEVTRSAKGVTITITSDDPKVVARVQKRAEAMKLMHEARSQP